MIYDVIIIGAGVSGLEVASIVNKKSKYICILEGRDRMGGRCYTDPIFGDIGAAWIHGENNALFNLVKKTNHLVPTHYENRMIYDIRNDSLPAKVISKDTLHDIEKEWEYIESKIEKLQDKGDNDISLQSGLEKAISILKKENKLHYLQDQALLNFYIKENYDLDYGCFLSNTSLWYFDCDRELKGEDYLITDNDKGLGNVIKKIYHHHDDQKESEYEIKFKTIVTSIVYQHHHKDAMAKGEDQLLEVHTNNGIYLCRYCVCTVPLGVLKKNIISFQPSLPSSFTSSLAQSYMGLLNKSILIFEDVFWDAQSIVIGAFGDNATEVWWILNLYLVSKQQQPMLVVFTGTEHASSRESQTDVDLTNKIITILQRIYPKKTISLLNAYHTRWASDPFSYGSYSVRNIGFKPESGFKGFQTSYYDGKLVFAGEHTSNDAFATVHGAIESGKRAAKQIMKGLESSSITSIDNDKSNHNHVMHNIKVDNVNQKLIEQGAITHKPTNQGNKSASHSCNCTVF